MSGNRDAKLTFSSDTIQQSYLRVKVIARWHYVRHTPAGKHKQDEEQSATDTFTFKITAGHGVWFSSRNVIARGDESPHTRNRLNYIQRFFDEIEQLAIQRKFVIARKRLERLSIEIKSLEKSIVKEQQKNPAFECQIALIESPIGRVKNDLKTLVLMSSR